jgi:aminoglycoside phosphotransferase (APT) family kinase protein
VPEPVAIGEPTDEFPFAWAVFRWIHGSTYAVGTVDEVTAGADLAGFVQALRNVPAPPDAPRGGRRRLAELGTSSASTTAPGSGRVGTP